jgi:antirestriction protein ArdC
MAAKVKRDIYQEITDRVIESIEKGVLPWACEWETDGGEFCLPVNFSTGENYKGINIMLLWMAQHVGAFSSSHWMTYKQAKAKGGQVRRGEKGTGIIFYKTLTKETDRVNSATGKNEIDHIPMLRSFTVFNLDQIDGIESPEKIELTGGFNPLEEAEKILMASGVKFNEGGTGAFYRPSTDEVTMPDRERFTNANDYYATAFHELGHATQHKTRCDAPIYESKIKKGAYAFFEVRAELTACFTMASLGLMGKNIDNHSSYIKGWLEVLKSDKKAIFRASAQAQKAHEWIEKATEFFNAQKAA